MNPIQNAARMNSGYRSLFAAFWHRKWRELSKPTFKVVLIIPNLVKCFFTGLGLKIAKTIFKWTKQWNTNEDQKSAHLFTAKIPFGNNEKPGSFISNKGLWNPHIPEFLTCFWPVDWHYLLIQITQPSQTSLRNRVPIICYC